jgi:hypothetical protein
MVIVREVWTRESMDLRRSMRAKVREFRALAEISAATFLGAPDEGYASRNYTYAQLAVGTLLARVVVALVFIKPYYTVIVFPIIGSRRASRTSRAPPNASVDSTRKKRRFIKDVMPADGMSAATERTGFRQVLSAARG